MILFEAAAEAEIEGEAKISSIRGLATGSSLSAAAKLRRWACSQRKTGVRIEQILGDKLLLPVAGSDRSVTAVAGRQELSEVVRAKEERMAAHKKQEGTPQRHALLQPTAIVLIISQCLWLVQGSALQRGIPTFFDEPLRTNKGALPSSLGSLPVAASAVHAARCMLIAEQGSHLDRNTQAPHRLQ